VSSLLSNLSGAANDDDPLAEADAALDKLAQTLNLENPAATPDFDDLDAMSVWSWYRSQGADPDLLQLFLDPIMTSVYGVDSREIGLLTHLWGVRTNGKCSKSFVGSC